jgi:hypothetical protein
VSNGCRSFPTPCEVASAFACRSNHIGKLGGSWMSSMLLSQHLFCLLRSGSSGCRSATLADRWPAHMQRQVAEETPHGRLGSPGTDPPARNSSCLPHPLLLMMRPRQPPGNDYRGCALLPTYGLYGRGYTCCCVATECIWLNAAPSVIVPSQTHLIQLPNR